MKRISVLILTVFSFFLFFNSCDLLTEEGLTEDEIVQGLKTALEIGTDTACSDLNLVNGYYGNELVKILLPPEADAIFDALENPSVVALGLDVALQKKIDSVVLAINRAAEDVADDAKPIFVNAITSMTISDGLNILQGNDVYSVSQDTSISFDSLAATHFMSYMTRDELFSLYEPKINLALSKDLGLGFSANDAWATLLWFYNNYIVILGFATIEEVDLSAYSADKGLDGLFLFVGNQEKAIRNDPYAWASDILEKVFGYVYEE
ncbi:MAG: DUF4197 domain-containing protein [Bacteroidales bacterium]|nr:DUF4197 domain-containing protein [Bacteroidales bacterium]